MRFERLLGLGSTVFYVHAGERYLGVVSETTSGEWLAAEPSGLPLAAHFDSAEAAGRGLAARECGTAPAALPAALAHGAASRFARPASSAAARLSRVSVVHP